MRYQVEVSGDRAAKPATRDRRGRHGAMEAKLTAAQTSRDIAEKGLGLYESFWSRARERPRRQPRGDTARASATPRRPNGDPSVKDRTAARAMRTQAERARDEALAIEKRRLLRGHDRVDLSQLAAELSTCARDDRAEPVAPGTGSRRARTRQAGARSPATPSNDNTERRRPDRVAGNTAHERKRAEARPPRAQRSSAGAPEADNREHSHRARARRARPTRARSRRARTTERSPTEARASEARLQPSAIAPERSSHRAAATPKATVTRKDYTSDEPMPTTAEASLGVAPNAAPSSGAAAETPPQRSGATAERGETRQDHMATGAATYCGASGAP